MRCNNHPENEVSGACVYCGKLFCSECLVEVSGKMYCKKDIGNVVNEAKQQAAAPATAPSFVINNANTNANTNTNNNSMGISAQYQKSKVVAAVLCFFLGAWGVHRFYVGKIGTGLLYLFTCGLFGVGALVDFILIIVGSFRDKAGLPLK